MKILVVGGGGREHALAWKLAQSPRSGCVYVAPGNAGTATEPGIENIAINADDIDSLLEFARDKSIDLTVVGPEAPLVAGIVDRFKATGLRCFGPGRQGAQLEGSKSFTKDFLHKYNIPTAAYASFTEAAAAIEYIRTHGAPIVIKADGLAAGKGVIVAQTVGEAESAVNDMLNENSFGKAGQRVVIEEFLSGEEASFICIIGHGQALPMASSQDHKARDDGDIGPNTGGMGAYSPAPIVDAKMHERIMQQVILPTVAGLVSEGIDYCGFLYAGVMVGPDGVPRVVEYNCRFGDPEAQPIMTRLESDLVELCDAALDGKLAQIDARWNPQPCLGVVMAAGGYPFEYSKGDIIEGLEAAGESGAKVFHAGTGKLDGRVVTSGGRVLCVVALGESVSDASRTVYDACQHIHWHNAYYRRDIGHRAIAREATTTQERSET